MATDIERLVVSIEANTTKMEAQLQKLTGTVDSRFKEIESRTDSLVSSVSDKFGELGKRLIEVFGAEKVFEFVKGLAETAESLEVVANRTGVSVEKLQGLQAAGRAVSISSGDMSGALDVLSRNLGRASAGQGDLGKVMLQYGIAPGKDLITTFYAVADAVKNAGTRQEEYRITTAAFGRSSAELVGLLRQGSDALREQVNAYQGIDDATVRRLADLNKAWKELGVTFQTMAAGPVADVLGDFTAFLKELETGNWQDKLGVLWKYLNTPITDLLGLTGAQKSLDALLARRDALSKPDNSAMGQYARSTQGRNELDAAIFDARQLLAQLQSGQIQSSVDITGKVGGKPEGGSARLSALDEYVAKLKLAAEIAGKTADERERDLALIEAANVKLADEGKHGTVLLDSMKAVNAVLSGQERQIVDNTRRLEDSAKAAEEFRERLDLAREAAAHPGALDEKGIADQVKKDNLAGIDAAVKVLDLDDKRAFNQQHYLDDLKAETALISMLPGKREEEIDLLRLRNKYGDEFVKQNEDEIRGEIRKQQAARDFAQVQQVAIDDIANFGDRMDQAGGKFGRAVEGMVLDIVKLIVKLTIARELESTLGSGGGGGFFGFLGGLLGIGGGGAAAGAVGIADLPTFAAGGANAAAGQRFIVGEKGPEFFVPNVPGTIYPSGTGPGGGGNVMNVNIDLRGSNGSQEIQQAVQAGMAVAYGKVKADFPGLMADAQMRHF